MFLWAVCVLVHGSGLWMPCSIQMDYGKRIGMDRNMGQMMDLHGDSPYKTLAVRKSHHLMLHSVVFLFIFLSLQARRCDDVKYLRHAAAWQLADIVVLSVFVLPARAFFLQIMDSPRAVQVARRVSPSFTLQS